MQNQRRVLLRRRKCVIVLFFCCLFLSHLAFPQDTLKSQRAIITPDSQSRVQFRGEGRPGSQLLLRLLRPPNVALLPSLKSLRFGTIDSLSQLHPELKDYLLKQAIIQGALSEDSLNFALRQEFASHLPKWARSDSGLFQEPRPVGTPYNINGVPLLPPQLNLMGLLMLLFKWLGI